jgi:hypothetical protein
MGGLSGSEQSFHTEPLATVPSRSLRFIDYAPPPNPARVPQIDSVPKEISCPTEVSSDRFASVYRSSQP